MKNKLLVVACVLAMVGCMAAMRYSRTEQPQPAKQAFEGQITFLNDGLKVFSAKLAKPPEMIHVRVYEDLYAVVVYEIVDDDRHVTYGRVITGELKELAHNQWEVDSPEPIVKGN